MATISTNEFKNGIGLKIDGKMYTIVEFQHVKPGKGAAFVRTKVRDVLTGRVTEKTFRSGEKFEDLHIEYKEMQFLYTDGEMYHFMDPESFEQIELADDMVGEDAKWLKENDTVKFRYADGDIIGVEPPMFLEAKVTMTEPGFKGDTVQGGSKPATLETGATVQVPMFINIDDVVRVDTRDGSYVTRV